MRMVATALLLLVTAGLLAQDRDWVRMWDEAQRGRPRTVPSTARIAPPSEPGTPLVVHGRIVGRDGKTPAANVIVFAYHTDATGVYHRRGARGWRLRGWAKTDAAGRFVLQTIRPAPYPDNRVAAHIHFTIEGPALPRRWTRDLQFAGDPFLTERERGTAAKVTTRGGVQHVNYLVRITDEGRF